MSDIQLYDTVYHPDLGLGEVQEIRHSMAGIPIYAIVDWDKDPSQEYNMGDNPSLIEISTLTISNE